MVWPIIAAAATKALPAIMGSAATAGISHLLGQSSASTQSQRAHDAMIAQNVVNQSNYRNRYQWTVEDMKLAGLNPILAASGGFSVGNAPSVSLPSPAFGGMPSTPSLAASAKDMSEVDRIEEDVKRISEDKKRIINLSKLAKAQVLKIGDERSVLRQDVIKTWNEADRIVADTFKIEQEMQLIRAQKRVAQETMVLIQEQKKQASANKELLRTKMKQLYLLFNQMRKKHGVYGNWYGTGLSYIGETLDAFGIRGFVGGVVGKKSSTPPKLELK